MNQDSEPLEEQSVTGPERTAFPGSAALRGDASRAPGLVASLGELGVKSYELGGKSVPETMGEFLGAVANLLHVIELAQPDDPMSFAQRANCFTDARTGLYRVRALYAEIAGVAPLPAAGQEARVQP